MKKQNRADTGRELEAEAKKVITVPNGVGTFRPQGGRKPAKRKTWAFGRGKKCKRPDRWGLGPEKTLHCTET